MSAPVVAGAIALMLQKDKNLSHTEIAYLIKKNARKDTFSSFVENNTYGSGKLNVFQTLKYNYRFGCKLDTGAFNYDSTIDFHRQDSCIQKVYGCMDSLAINYNPLANVNNGSCIYGAWNIKELQFSKILIFPNPASSIVNIENKSNQPIQIEIRNLYSQLIKNGLIDKKITWDVSEWARGIYFIQVVENEIYSTIKLILK
jgi:hypothetical protein